MTFIELFQQLSIPKPSELIGRTKAWMRENGAWWVGSFVGHFVVLTLVLLLIGPVSSRIRSEAPLFNVDMDSNLPEPELTHFEVGETPLEPSVLNTETL